MASRKSGKRKGTSKRGRGKKKAGRKRRYNASKRSPRKYRKRNAIQFRRHSAAFY